MKTRRWLLLASLVSLFAYTGTGKLPFKNQTFNKLLLPVRRSNFTPIRANMSMLEKPGDQMSTIFHLSHFPIQRHTHFIQHHKFPNLLLASTHRALCGEHRRRIFPIAQFSSFQIPDLSSWDKFLSIRIRRNTGMIHRMRKFYGSQQHMIFNGAQARVGRELIRRT